MAGSAVARHIAYGLLLRDHVLDRHPAGDHG